MNLTVLTAIFKRDFVNYFASATGYVFICVFVMLSSVAAFVPPGFFSNNLANLDQLSSWMPYILLVFVPAITMSMWAEEKRRGTDELLLTLPATDSDVVLGKYLAGVAIFTVSLLFSMASILLIFQYGLGDPDLQLFVCTYIGYWFVGLAMLATGMVASFLTSNLTVGFILGMLFNAPQALASTVDNAIGWLDAVPPLRGLAEAEWFRNLARGVFSSFSAFDGFSDFARGVLSLSGALHFLCIVALMLYLCMVLIGRRHWAGGDDGESLWWHYLVRGLALFLIVGGVNAVLRNYDPVRFDMTADKTNSLLPQTKTLVAELGDDDETPPIKIDAYFSPEVPSEYAGQKRELLSTLDELRAISKGKVVVVKHEVENFSDEAALAERAYGIEARSVSTRVRGEIEEEQIFLGAAFSCGLDKVVIPFFDKGIPVEYEVVRSITTVAQQKRKRIGVVKTATPLFSGFSMQGPSPSQTPESRLVAELKKQYDVVEVDPANPITDTFDVLLAVQPSSLTPDALVNFVAAVKTGQPTAIFEDPAPVWWQVVGTDEPNRPGGGMMGMFGGGQPPAPKGDMQQLWSLLGARVDGSQIVWQFHNPYEASLPGLGPEYLFTDVATAENAFNNASPITKGLKQALFVYAGAASATSGAETEFLPLAVTSNLTGAISTDTFQQFRTGRLDQSAFEQRRRKTGRTYIVAAKITGAPPEEVEAQLDDDIDDEALRAEAEGGAEADLETGSGEASDDEQPEVNVVLVADIDCLASEIFNIREIGDDEVLGVDFKLQNVSLILNILDDLAGDDRYIALRKRTRDYRTLTQIEQATEEFRESTLDEDNAFREGVEEEIAAARTAYSDAIAKIMSRTDLDAVTKEQLRAREEIRQARIRDVKITALEQKRRKNTEQNQRELANYVRNVQDRYKAAAVIVPPIPPLLLGLWVYFRRRSMEKEGVSKDRLRYSRKQPKAKGAGEAA